jgi:formylglycine-generating enzyme required for sulfatase activity
VTRAIVILLAACGGAAPRAEHPGAARAPLSLASEDQMVAIPEGKYIAGSTPEERAASYDDYQAATTLDTARELKVFDREEDRHQEMLAAFKIDLMPVTQAQFAEFVSAGKASPPSIDEAAWRAQGGHVSDPAELARFVWHGPTPPNDRLDHPVVLVTWDEATRYCAWRGELRGELRRLPTAAEFEKASRGDGGVAYPWGNTFDAHKLNSAEGGPKDTVPAGTFTEGASPYGVLDMAGNVMQWTSSPGPDRSKLVKGSGWLDHAGQGRAASAMAIAPTTRAIDIGFRCAGPP